MRCVRRWIWWQSQVSSGDSGIVQVIQPQYTCCHLLPVPESFITCGKSVQRYDVVWYKNQGPFKCSYCITVFFQSLKRPGAAPPCIRIVWDLLGQLTKSLGSFFKSACIEQLFCGSLPEHRIIRRMKRHGERYAVLREIRNGSRKRKVLISGFEPESLA